MVLQSMTTTPGAAPSSAPAGPRSTWRTRSAVMRQVMTTEAPRAASAGELARCPPRSACCRMRSGAVSKPRTANPALMRFSARAEPSSPMPMRAIVSRTGFPLGTHEIGERARDPHDLVELEDPASNHHDEQAPGKAGRARLEGVRYEGEAARR